MTVVCKAMFLVIKTNYFDKCFLVAGYSFFWCCQSLDSGSPLSPELSAVAQKATNSLWFTFLWVVKNKIVIIAWNFFIKADVFSPRGKLIIFIYESVKVKYSLTFAVIEALPSPNAVQGCVVLDTEQLQGSSLGQDNLHVVQIKKRKVEWHAQKWNAVPGAV